MEEKKRLRRSNDKVIAGVCGGLAEYFNIDPVLVRVVFALLLLFASGGFWLYLILWIVMPAPEGEGQPQPPASDKDAAA